MTPADLAALRDDVLSLEMLVAMYADTEDRRLASTKRKLKAARAKLAEAEAKASRPTYTDQETLTLVQGCTRLDVERVRDRIAAMAREQADLLDASAPKGEGSAEYHYAAMTLRSFADQIEALS